MRRQLLRGLNHRLSEIAVELRSPTSPNPNDWEIREGVFFNRI
jgi:hypothetical protein